MGDWALISWWVGGGVAAMALAVVVLALFRDRARGRRRCPGCWYDMSGVKGMTCPECGRTQKGERRFLRTRRRWRGVVVGAVMLVVASGTAVAPAVYTGKWAAYTPVGVLRLVLGFFSKDAAAVARRVAGAGNVARLTAWERLLLAHSLAAEMRRGLAGLEEGGGDAGPEPVQISASSPFAWMTPYDFAGQLGVEAKPLLPELARALGAPQEYVRARAVVVHEALGQAAAANLPEVRRLLETDERAEVRHDCVYLVALLGGRDQRSIRVLRGMSRNESDSGVRLQACMAMIMLEPDAAETVELLGGAARECEVSERKQAVQALGWLAHAGVGVPGSQAGGQVGGMSTLAVFGTDIFTRLRTAWRGGRYPNREADARAAELAGGALGDPDAGVREAAAEALAGLGARVDAFAPRLRAGLTEEGDDRARRAMIWAYMQAASTDHEFVLAQLTVLLRGEDVEAQHWAARVLRSYGSRAAGAVPALRDAALGCDPRWAGVFCEALRVMGSEGWLVLAELAPLAGVRGSIAATELGEVAAEDPGAVRALVIAANSATGEARVNMALPVQRCLRNQGVVDELSRLATADADEGVRRGAKALLARRAK